MITDATSRLGGGNFTLLRKEAGKMFVPDGQELGSVFYEIITYQPRFGENAGTKVSLALDRQI